MLLAWYAYGLFLNSLDLGIHSTFNRNGEVIKSIRVWSPLLNLIKPFTPFGLTTTAVRVLIICLITKKGYTRFSGSRFVRDKRGFDILPDGTHGTSGFMTKKQRKMILDTGATGTSGNTFGCGLISHMFKSPRITGAIEYV
ncbi:hypothetical protein SAMN02745823_03543 [Sporobacter termitidis DSM 10068]|uniref:Uncharacterized protein n=1 Tax=Sporobacter termitidis DSM 10068 TaxID=1123282 RepID=A0A1M5ZCU0_9FIRM|nr:hypothetical protein SAMN02745823_03543 [Sporobacter termitidis DSM 10068]